MIATTIFLPKIMSLARVMAGQSSVLMCNCIVLTQLSIACIENKPKIYILPHFKSNPSETWLGSKDLKNRIFLF